MGTNYYAIEKSYKPNRQELHIGKSSAGWKFCFQGYLYEDDYCPHIQSIKDWKEYIKNNNMLIFDEYNERISSKDFWNMVEKKQEEKNPEDFKYDVNVEGYRFNFRDFS